MSVVVKLCADEVGDYANMCVTLSRVPVVDEIVSVPATVNGFETTLLFQVVLVEHVAVVASAVMPKREHHLDARLKCVRVSL